MVRTVIVIVQLSYIRYALIVCNTFVSVQKFISEDRLPHLLFYGPPGTGKTSTILACAKQLYKEKEFNSMVLEVCEGKSVAIKIKVPHIIFIMIIPLWRVVRSVPGYAGCMAILNVYLNNINM